MFEVLLDRAAAHRETIAWIGAASAVLLLLGALAVPWIVLRLPEDALRRTPPLQRLRRRHPVLRALLFVLRNLVGLPLLALGVVMLVTPGQGVLTILLALGVMDFPGKHRVVHAILENRAVLRTLNWIRARGRRPPLSPSGSPSPSPGSRDTTR